MEERRREPRVRSLLNGRMTFNDRQCAMTCTVRNVSENGALIKHSEMFRMPEEFELNIPRHDETRRARVVWRRHDGAGLLLSPAEERPVKAEPALKRMWLQGSPKREKKGMTLGY
jgi:hypothetical protein